MQHMDTRECADYLGVHYNTVRRYVHEEGLPVLKFPGRNKWIFRKDLVDAWIFERSQPEMINAPSDKSGHDDSYGKLRVLIP